MRILLDSSVLIWVMRKKLELESETEYFINPIVYGEVAYGLENMGKNVVNLDLFLESRHILVVDIGVMTAKIFAVTKVKLKHNPIADNDLLVGCSAMEYKIKLWTLNIKHFERIPGLEMVK
jgi:predicted nucleic acid-binding protein